MIPRLNLEASMWDAIHALAQYQCGHCAGGGHEFMQGMHGLPGEGVVLADSRTHEGDLTVEQADEIRDLGMLHQVAQVIGRHL